VGRERAIHAPMFAIMNALFGKNGWTWENELKMH
jgi:hypothetical protein